MKDSTYNELKKYPEVQLFVSRLMDQDIPISAIMTNHIEHSPEAVVYVTVPYGNPNGGITREYRRLAIVDAVKAGTWYRNSVRSSVKAGN